MIEIASFCLLIGIGEGLKNAAKNPETAERASGEVAEACDNGKCFVAGTLISTPLGLVSIENIKAGDTVYSFDEKTQAISKQVVEETFVRESNELLHIGIAGETLSTTPEHRFYVPQKGFVNAIDLRAGDSLWTVNGECVIIEKIQHEILESSVKVYNFRVANNHTYFVGKTNVGVHNSYDNLKTPSGEKRFALGLREYLDGFAENNGAKTWKDLPDPTNWKQGVIDALHDPDTDILFNLDGVDNPWSAVMRASSGRGGATDWELFQIKNTPEAWGRVIWYLNGEIVPNPFE